MCCVIKRCYLKRRTQYTMSIAGTCATSEEMAAVDIPGIHGYQNTGSSDGEVTSDKETSKHRIAKKKRDSGRRGSNSSSDDSDDSKRKRLKRNTEDDDRKKRRRREERRRHSSSEREDNEKRENRHDTRRREYRRDYGRSRSRSRERYNRNRRRYDRQEYQSHSRHRNSISPERERIERRRRENDRERDPMQANRDLYWNKYDHEERQKTDRRSSRHRSREKESENRDPNSLRANEKESQKENVADGEHQAVAANKKNSGDNEGIEALTMRTGGAYIPPARLRMMQAALTDKESAAFQRFAWEALKKSIHGLINKINVTNIGIMVRELCKENIIRGRGLLVRSVMQAQAFSPTFTHVYAALVSIINSKFPQIGELILTRLVLLFRRGFRRNSKDICLSATRFIAHLVNQQVAHELVALEILYLLFQSPTNDSVEVALGFLKECGAKLTEVAPKGIHGIFDRLRSILHEGQLDKRVQYMIEVMFAIRKDGFKDHPSVLPDLDLVEEEEQFTHRIFLEDVTNGEDILNVFKHDPEYGANEEKYKTIRKEILDESSGDDESVGSGTESSSEEDEDGEGDQTIVDNTETNLVSLRRTIYLTIQSSLEYEECAHKLLKMELKPGQESELCHMILDCCAQQRTYEKFYGLLAQRFCQLNKAYVEPFETIFRDSYDTIHRLETNKLRNVAKLFAHLLHTDAINWTVLRHIKLNEEDTTSSSRIFIKILFQELSEYMGLPNLNKRVKDMTLQEAFAGLFPRDNPCNTRFAINFFTSIGLGGLTDELREQLKSQPKASIVPPPPPASKSSHTSSASSSSSSSSSSASSSSSSSSSSEDDSS